MHVYLKIQKLKGSIEIDYIYKRSQEYKSWHDQEIQLQLSRYIARDNVNFSCQLATILYSRLVPLPFIHVIDPYFF